MNDIGLNEGIFILFGSRQNAVESRFPKEKQERAPRMNSNGIAFFITSRTPASWCPAIVFRG